MMRTRDTVGLGTMPANRLFRVGGQSINAGVDDTGIQADMQNLSRYVADDDKSGESIALYPKAVASYTAQHALSDGAGLGVYSEDTGAPHGTHMELNDGEIAYVLKKGEKNDRWAVHFRGRNNMASLPVRTSLGSVLLDEGQLPAWLSPDQKKALRKAKALRKIHPVGLVNTPGSTADMGGNTTVHVMGPISIKATYRSIEAGQLVYADALDESEYRNTTLDARAREGIRPVLVPRGMDWVAHDLQYLPTARYGCQQAYDAMFEYLKLRKSVAANDAAKTAAINTLNDEGERTLANYTTFVGAVVAAPNPNDLANRHAVVEQIVNDVRGGIADGIALACFDTIVSIYTLATHITIGIADVAGLHMAIATILFALYAFADPVRIDSAGYAEGMPLRRSLTMAWQQLIHGVRSSLVEHDDKIIGRAHMPIPQGMTGEILAQF